MKFKLILPSNETNARFYMYDEDMPFEINLLKELHVRKIELVAESKHITEIKLTIEVFEGIEIEGDAEITIKELLKMGE